MAYKKLVKSSVPKFSYNASGNDSISGNVIRKCYILEDLLEEGIVPD